MVTSTCLNGWRMGKLFMRHSAVKTTLLSLLLDCLLVWGLRSLASSALHGTFREARCISVNVGRVPNSPTGQVLRPGPVGRSTSMLTTRPAYFEWSSLVQDRSQTSLNNTVA